MDILSSTQIGDLVNRFKPIAIEEMPKHVVDGTTFDHPVIDKTFRSIPLPGGRSYQKQASIDEANYGTFYYAFLDGPALERYGGAFRVVTKDCEAAAADGKRIPDENFNSQGVIYRNGLLYCYCSWEFHKQMQAQSEENASLALHALLPKVAGEEKDEHGRSLAVARHTKLESQLVETGDKSTRKKG